MISITIASKHKEDRRTITALIARQDDFKMASVGEDGYHAVRSSMTIKPDIIIMDYDMDDINSLNIMPVIKRNSPSTALITLCPDKEIGVIDKAIQAGISGFLLWKKDLDKLVSAVRSVYYGGLYISETAKDFLSAKYNPMNSTAPVHRHMFTFTEHNIFNGIILGREDKEIADDLNMTIGALRNSINKAKKKTGLHNRTQIAVYALLNGIINLANVKEKLLNAGN